MKKLLLIAISAVLIQNAFSQSLTLSDANGPVDPGQLYHVLGDPAQVEPMKASIYVTNNGASTIQVFAKKVIQPGDTLEGTSNYFCWGVCYPSWVYESPISVDIAPGQTITDFYGDYEPKGIAGKSFITYVWWVNGNPTDSVALDVEFNASAAAIYDIVNEGTVKIFPNPAQEKFQVDYDFSSEISDATFIISNILGSKVKEFMLTDRSGKLILDISDLQEGVYFCYFILDGQMANTEKLVVRR